MFISLVTVFQQVIDPPQWFIQKPLPTGTEATMENFMKDKKRDSLLNHSDKLQRNITPKGSITIKHPMPLR